MLLNLDLNDTDTGPLITFCLEKKLTRALIYICTKGNDGEFMAPLSRLWGLYLHNKNEKNDKNTENYGF